MSTCYRCQNDDIYGSTLRGTKGDKQQLVWVCPRCKDDEGEVIKFSGQGRVYALIGLPVVMTLIICATVLIGRFG